jgi:mono/diheme cytochrome c family protein
MAHSFDTSRVCTAGELKMTQFLGSVKKLALFGMLLTAPIIMNGQQARDPLGREVVKHGQDIYANSCASCHGEAGRGGSAPRLSERGFDAQYIERVITYGAPATVMHAWGQRLIALDLLAVVGYVKSLNGMTSSLEAGSSRVLSGEAARGRDLFVDVTRELGSCSNCHAVNGKGVNMAPPMKNVPPGASALRGLATRQVKTATVNGGTFPAVVLTQMRDETKLYDLTTVPPVLRTFPSSAVKVTDGSTWQHASVLGTYSNQDLELILTFLRTVVQP